MLSNLKPKGRAVFIFQPNYEKLGQMRPWLWEFVAWAGEGMEPGPRRVWWSINTLPTRANVSHRRA